MTSLTPAEYIQQAEALASGVTIPLAEQPLRFLQEVWRVVPDNEIVGLGVETEYRDDAGLWQDTVHSEWAWAADMHQAATVAGDVLTFARARNKADYQTPGRGGIYWYTASRKIELIGKARKRGDLDQLLSIGSLWCDLDCAIRGYPLDRALEALEKLPLAPSIVIFSGGGLQAVWLLAEAWRVPNRESAHEFKDRITQFFSSITNFGFELDISVFDATRMMRLPGFVNRKPTRGGAMARILRWNPERRYRLDEVMPLAPLPIRPPKLPSLVSAALEIDGTTYYRVSHTFAAYLIDGEDPIERHPTARHLMLQAAKAGMSPELFMERARPFFRRWFRAESNRAGGEMDRTAEWAWRTIAEDPEATPNGSLMVTCTETGFAAAPDPVLAVAFDRTVIPVLPEPLTQIADTESRLPLEQAREKQRAELAEYAYHFKPKSAGTFMVVQSPPGLGKTHELWQIAANIARESLTAHMEKENRSGTDLPYRGPVAFLTLFKFEKDTWKDHVRQFGVDPDLVGYIHPRNPDSTNPGYCALHAQSEIVASKNWNVVQTLCSRCPLQQQCKQNWYLSQFNRARNAPILLARHQHAQLEELMVGRSHVMIDESPLQVVSTPLELTPNDFKFSGGTVFLSDQHPKETALIGNLIEALRGIVQLNPAPPEKTYPTEEHVKLGGRWLFDRLVAELDPATLAEFVRIDEKLIKAFSKIGLDDVTPENVAVMPINYLRDLWGVLQYEYNRYFCPEDGRKPVDAWNSRLIVVGNTLRIYRMEPLSFTKKTKVMVADATGLDQQYETAFSDKQGRPRIGHYFGLKLEKHARVIQYVGSDNSRTTMRSKPRKADETAQTSIDASLPELRLEMASGEVRSIDPAQIDQPDNELVERAKKLITRISAEHHGSLLVITYKDTVQVKLAKWARRESVLPASQIQWFGAVRGKNDWKHLEAVLVIGTPRIQQIDLLINAQIWHWRDETPIRTERVIREALYQDYSDPADGQPRAYQYMGYADPRVNAIYLNQISAELRQCYERIRPETMTEAARTVYLATAFPCADHVDELRKWGTMEIDSVARDLIQTRLSAGTEVWEAELISDLREQTGVSINTARDSIRRVLLSISAELGARAKLTATERATKWLQADQMRAELPNQAVADLLDISLSTVKRARKSML